MPSLTTISQPIAAYARALTELALGGINEREARKPQRVTLREEPIFRESTGFLIGS